MVRYANFRSLKFGDSLARIDENGKIEFFVYLSRDPGLEDNFCFLKTANGIEVKHFHKTKIESEFLVFDNSYELFSLQNKNTNLNA